MEGRGYSHFKLLSKHLAGGTKKNHEEHQARSRCVGQDSSLGPCRYKV